MLPLLSASSTISCHLQVCWQAPPLPVVLLSIIVLVLFLPTRHGASNGKCERDVMWAAILKIAGVWLSAANQHDSAYGISKKLL